LVEHGTLVGKLCIDDKGEPRLYTIYKYKGDLTRTYRWFAAHHFRCNLWIVAGEEHGHRLECEKRGYYYEFSQIV
jgi:predicted esterase YcpF (UPF0227 family)